MQYQLRNRIAELLQVERYGSSNNPQTLNALADSDHNELSEPHNVVLALSSAYCRFLANVDEASHAEQLGQVAALADRIASVAMKAVSNR